MRYLSFLLLISTCLINACSTQRYSDPLTPEEALQDFKLAEGFKIELFAAEPYVWDPVSLIFDEKGHAYVVEMPDYPYKPEPEKAKGRIRRLIDTNGDGEINETIIFADSLSEATSILPWKGGLLVTTAPNILYLKDTNGDYQADTKEILFSGFFENNSEAQITNLRFSVDNWIYAANFGQPGEVIFSRKPEATPLSMRGGDFRFRLDQDLFELATGPTQFGHAIDDWGNRFMSQNTIHLRQAVIPWRYMNRHPYLPSKNALQNISDHDLEMFQATPPPYWRAERTRRRQKKYDEQNLDRIEYAEDHFTGASGATFYGGDAFSEEYYGDIFIGDVAGNLIHRDVLNYNNESPVFIAQRAQTELNKEFLISSDPWFRPANFTLGPDGYLYVIDMYRQHIETPLSIPEDLKADMDFYNGSQKGRIYRIMPSDSEVKSFRDISSLDNQEYLELLTHPNQWQRLQAHRLLIEKQDATLAPGLRKLFFEHQDPRTRLHALYVLDGLGLIEIELVKQALQDTHPRIREHGAILSEAYPESLRHLLNLVDDSDIRVIFQAALSLGEFSNQEVLETLAKIVKTHGNNSWFRMAILSSQAGSAMAFMELLLSQNYFSPNGQENKMAFLEDFAQIIGARSHNNEVAQFIEILTHSAFQATDDWQFHGLKGLSNGLKKGKVQIELDDSQKEILEQMTSEDHQALNELIEGLLK